MTKYSIDLDTTIDVEVKVNKTSDLEECHGVTSSMLNTEVEIVSLHIMGFEVDISKLPVDLITEITNRATEQV